MIVRAASVVTAMYAAWTVAEVTNANGKQLVMLGGRLVTKEVRSNAGTLEELLAVWPTRTLTECMITCGHSSTCQSAVWDRKRKLCSVRTVTCDRETEHTGSGYYCGHKVPLSPYETFNIRGCSDLQSAGITASGVFYMDPDGSGAFPVLCEFIGGESWLTIQRRMDGSQDFFRNWESYRNGFGDFSTEFWLGLENIRRLSASGVELSIYLDTFDGSWAYANYSRFSLGSESARYPLNISGYSGNAGDDLAYHNGAPFSTYDRDFTWMNCSNKYKGAWWYVGCHNSNLNGLYLRGSTMQFATSDCWRLFKGFHYALKTTVMRVKV